MNVDNLAIARLAKAAKFLYGIAAEVEPGDLKDEIRIEADAIMDFIVTSLGLGEAE